MKKLPKFIENLVKEGQLKYSVDRDITVDWPWTKIAGPCSVEGGPGDRFNIVDIAKNVKEIARIRKLVPNSYLLIPGIGAQGGSLKDICNNGLDSGLKLLVNSSRSIIYSSNAKDYAEKAMLASSKIQEEMERYIIEKGII